jgi:hypothetical protein
LKIVLVGDDGQAVAEIDEIEQYDLSTTRGRAMLVDDILVALGQADRRKVLEFIRDTKPSDDGSKIASIVSELEHR